MKQKCNIKESWIANAKEWISIINREGIASRKFTNQAIIDTVIANAGHFILDAGCGEGWLTRALSNKGFNVTGIDATEALINRARNLSESKFYRLSYEELIDGILISEAPFDGIIFNYSLYEKELTPLLLKILHNYLKTNGKIFIQTIHPDFLSHRQLPDKSQWIQNAWNGLDGDFIKPHAWYARTKEDWVTLFKSTNYQVKEVVETTNEKSQAVSIIFVLDRN